MSIDAHSETNIVDTLQSLTVAFALAMTVRSFVTEGFVIPTGSMAPTLLGAHSTFRSPDTGYEYPFDFAYLASAAEAARDNRRVSQISFTDPMVHPTIGVQSVDPLRFKEQMGDRVLVLKYVYLFEEPERWDVVVFKNPTDPIGESQNYIKRLIGLPNERLLTVDGDIWTAPLNPTNPGDLSGFHIERKPEHVQRAVWQLVHDSDFVPIDPAALSLRIGRSYEGSPWKGTNWKTSTADYRCDTAEPSLLEWTSTQTPIDDRCSYNLLRMRLPIYYSVSDIRVAAAVEADAPASFTSDFVLEARAHTLVWHVGEGKASLVIADRETSAEVGRKEVAFDVPSEGAPFKLEFWHVDQSMSMWVNDREIARLDYDSWSVEDRIRYSFPDTTLELYKSDPPQRQPEAPRLAWKFAGSPVTLHHVRTYRDLYYRPQTMNASDQCLSNGPAILGPGFGTDLSHPAEVLADQFVMMGDNSACSRDGRVWGRPHPLVVNQLGVESPFVVPRELLLGPGWSVYFPAPLTHDAKPDVSVVPNFGKLRFIR